MTPRHLRRWREQRGLTQQEAGEWYGLPPAHAARTWRRWELGERPIPGPLAQRIAQEPPHLA